MSLKSIQAMFNEACGMNDSYAINDLYIKRSKELNKNNWADLAIRYYDLMQEALNGGNKVEADFYNAKYEEAKGMING